MSSQFSKNIVDLFKLNPKCLMKLELQNLERDTRLHVRRYHVKIIATMHYKKTVVILFS